MISRELIDNDIHVDKGRVAITDGGLQVGQSVQSRLRLFRGEWFLDIQAGLPWYQQVLGTRNMSRAEHLIKREILQTPGVTKLTRFDVTLDRRTRRMKVSFVFVANSGETVEDELYLPV